MDVDAIAERFSSYDLLEIKKTGANGTSSDELDYSKINKILCQKGRISTISLSDEPDGIEEVDKVRFNAIVGNPPYQEADGGARCKLKAHISVFCGCFKKTISQICFNNYTYEMVCRRKRS